MTDVPARPLTGPFGHRALRLGRVLGIDVGVDLSWLLIFVLITMALAQGFGAEHEHWSTATVWLAGAVASLLFFLGILLHELGHSVTSIALGLPVRSITLFLFGGLASLGGEPSRPRDQFLIGVAGPAVSVALGVLFLAVGWLLPSAPVAAEVAGAICVWLGTVNLVIAAFNMLPGHPLDGGHVVKAAVWAASGDRRLGTRVASALGGAFATLLMAGGAVLVLLGGALNGLWLILIGWFLMRAAGGTATSEALRETLERVSVAEAMDEQPPREDADVSVADLIAGAVLRRGERSVCVVRDGAFVGLVTLHEVKRVPVDERETTSLGAIAIPRDELLTVASDASLWEGLRAMDDRGVSQVPVLEGGELAGLLTRERVMRVMRNLVDLGRAR